MRRLLVLVAGVAIFIAGCTLSGPPAPTGGPTVPTGTPWPVPTPVIHWQPTVSKAVAGEPVRLILAYQPYLSAPPTNDITFTAVCTTCSAGQPPLLGRLVLTPEFCASTSTQPNPNGQICWSAPVTFPRAGTWHFTSPYDADLVITSP